MRKGFYSFIKRFTDRFPKETHRYVLSVQNKVISPPTVFVGDCLSHLNDDGECYTLSIYHGKTDDMIARIYGNLQFGIQMRVASSYLSRPFFLYRRPKNNEQIFNRREWLTGKPRFAKLGSSLASQIAFRYEKACFSCLKGERKFADNLCQKCHDDILSVSNMQSEGGQH